MTSAGASGSIRSTGTCTASSASSSGDERRDAATTRMPSSSNVRVIARPMPCDAPVTTATCPFS